ncbi:hypothetical protein IWT5_01193 [Secundilactobacillus silagincola]|uniref:DUF5776 domain-containing protein n=1 Tax=Secundilactobacillus silagincola TaxID=1714681 RepID=A0A1Z5J2K8_9LACO|nr:leucine-rich repeat domain-containing protein [Secundilactobacillus silagincola]GAX08042.1 hypothetical protein IWT5_01193 [Secundilactobacillus silagincola]
MKKRIKLFSSALAVGMLLGTGVGSLSAVTQQEPDTTVTAKASEQSPRAEQVTIDENDVTIDRNTGLITDFTNAEKAELLLAGGELVVPETIGDGESRVTVTGVADDSNNYAGVFDKDHLESLTGTYDGVMNGISNVTFAKPDNIKFIGRWAFYNNQITMLNLPAITEIGFEAFEDNQITTLNLPAVTEIGTQAFNRNQITTLSLPVATKIDAGAFKSNQITTLSLPAATEIGEEAFHSNALINIKLHQDANVGSSAFEKQNISHEVMPNKDGEIGFDTLKPTFLKGTAEQIKTISAITINGEDAGLRADNENKKITGANHPEQYSVNLETELDHEGSLPGNYYINSYELTINPFEESTDGGESGGTPGGGGTLPEDGSNGGETDTNPDNGNSGESGNNGNEIKPEPAPKPEEKRPHTVYAKRGMRLHRNVSLTSPIKSYKKQSRAKAANFRVRGIAYDKNGKKRYKVDGGYITAGATYVADSHFRSNKVRQVRVLNNRINSYKDVKLSSNKKVRSYKKGTKLKVKRIVNYGRATRFELTNGRYITGNKQLLIMDQK